MSTRAFGVEHAERNPFGPRLLGRRGAVACEHYLAAMAAHDLLAAGGNAIDAAVGATLVEGVVNPHQNTLGGECPMLIATAAGEVVSVNGNTAAPALATPEAYRARGHEDLPEEGILAAGVPATPGALLTVLERLGRLSFAEVVAPAQALAREGFPVHRGLVHMPRYGLAANADRMRAEWHASAGIYLPDGRVPEEGECLRNPALADLLDALAAAEASAPGDRGARIRAVADEFYRGGPAAAIDAFSRERDGFLRRADLERFETRLEGPVRLGFAGVDVCKCGPWNQGPVLLQSLAMLEHVDLAGMEHNGTDYVHALVEVMNLAFADREQFYGDPAQVDVPIEALLDRDYAAARAALVDPERASRELRPGDPRRGSALLPEAERLGGASWGAGTVHVDVADAEGNLASFTPSGAWLRSCEVVPALGFPLGNRLMTFYLGPAHHPNVVAPGRRPRTTISPTLVLREGRPWLACGSMGGDQQDQWQLQLLLNLLLFDMPLQAAIEAPKLSSEHFPGFFAPHDRFPCRVRIEPRVGADVLNALAARGHDVETAADWTEGYLLAVARDPGTGLLEAACDPRGAKADVFPAFALCW